MARFATLKILSIWPHPFMSTAVAFFRQALRNPRAMASVVPSGQALALIMASSLPSDTRCVVELGPGTGPVTQSLLDRGIAPERLLAVEYNRELGLALRRQYPKVKTVIADAQLLPFVLRDSKWPPQVDAIVSSLGLRAMSPGQVEAIARAANGSLKIGGVFVQYSYRKGSPIPMSLCRQLGWEVEIVDRIWRNLPPATVFRYTKR